MKRGEGSSRVSGVGGVSGPPRGGGGRGGGAGGGRVQVFTTRLETPLGEMVAGATDAGVCLLEFAARRSLRAQLAQVEKRVGSLVPGSHPHTEVLQVELGEFLAGKRKDFSVPVVMAGTGFQERVWRALCEIPYGTTVSYGQLARRAGADGGMRAVGRANGDNRIAIVVPCHRVIRADGHLGGYSGGLDLKRRLLDLEAGTLQPSLL